MNGWLAGGVFVVCFCVCVCLVCACCTFGEMDGWMDGWLNVTKIADEGIVVCCMWLY